MASDKGGEPGQWSARKSQLLVREYEKQGGGYKGEKDEAARSLEEWSEEDWQTEAGDDRAREGNVTKRYLPKEVWEKLTDAEKEEAEHTKEEASKHGEQHVGYTDAIKKALHEVEEEHHHEDADEKESEKKGTAKKDSKKKSEKTADKKQSEAKQSDKSDKKKTNKEKIETKQSDKSDKKQADKEKNPEAKQSDKSDKKQSRQKGKSDDSDDGINQKELYEQAKELKIGGRSKMSREELEEAVQRAKG